MTCCKGVRYYGGGCTTQSIVMRSKSGTVRMIEAYHRLSKLNEYSAIDFTGDSTAAYPAAVIHRQGNPHERRLMPRQADVEYRIEHDTMGEVRVPINALWRAQTQRAVENFPISGRGLERTQIRALGLLKGACAQVNKDLGLLAPEKADAIIAAAGEIADGLHDDQFPIDVFQTGSGTSSNMNTNEVIASIAGAERRHRAPQRRRQHVAVVQRHLPHRHAHRGHRSRCAPPDSGARGAARVAGGQGPRSGAPWSSPAAPT